MLIKWANPRYSIEHSPDYLPVFIFLLTLINRKMSLSEALGFIATFLIIGTAFGLGFTLVATSVNE